MTVGELQTLPARRGLALYLNAGQAIKLINTHGTQVVDFWAYNRADVDEYMWMTTFRHKNLKLVPAVGDTFYTLYRRPILTIEEDTSPGVHDTVIGRCDSWRYEELGHPGHDNCRDNLLAAMTELGHPVKEAPAPLNVWMNVPWTPEGKLEFAAPLCKAGDHITFRAHMDCIIAMSACPQDILPVNGVGCVPVDVHFQVLD